MYELVLDAGYSATGIYLKATQYLIEAFYDKSISPDERMYRAWYCKTFFVLWERNVPVHSLFITKQTFVDVKCGIDGLLNYLIVLKRYFPESPVVPYFVNSEPNEQTYAFVRSGRYSGRRMNLDSITLGEGLETRNRQSELSLATRDASAVAHTRGRSALKPVVALSGKAKSKVSSDPVGPTKGSNITEQSLRTAMKRGTRDCIEECQYLQFPFFEGESPDAIVSFPESSSPQVKDLFSQVTLRSGSFPVMDLEEDDDFSEEEDLTHEDAPIDVEEESGSVKLLGTSLGQLPAKMAERIFLNKGGLRFAAQSRKNLVKSKKYQFDENAYWNFVQGTSKCCAKAIVKGDKVALCRFRKKKTGKVHGTARFLSHYLTPLNMACPVHSLPGVNVWVFIGDVSMCAAYCKYTYFL